MEAKKYDLYIGECFAGQVIYGKDDMDSVKCPKCETEICYMDDVDFFVGTTNFCRYCGCKLSWD